MKLFFFFLGIFTIPNASETFPCFYPGFERNTLLGIFAARFFAERARVNAVLFGKRRAHTRGGGHGHLDTCRQG